MVAESYFELPQATALSMLLGPDGRPWRRVGDVGWRDAQGHIWFRGRKNQRVTTGSANLHAIPSESIFNNHPLARRSALVGIGDPGSQRPVVVVEPLSKLRRGAWENLEKELRTLAKATPRAREIFTFLPKTGFPVDVRHNAKINREKLAVWAENALKARASSKRRAPPAPRPRGTRGRSPLAESAQNAPGRGRGGVGIMRSNVVFRCSCIFLIVKRYGVIVEPRSVIVLLKKNLSRAREKICYSRGVQTLIG